MQKNKVYFIGFILLALVQIFVPAKMIIDQKTVLKSGTEFRFKIQPVDPHDPFRGKYIDLYFEENQYKDSESQNWRHGELVYVVFATDSLGFAKINGVFKEKPTDTDAFLKIPINHPYQSGSQIIVTLDYPFNRFYMEESKAPKAEELTMRFDRDTTHIFHAGVYILNGKAALDDVYVDGVPIGQYIMNNR
jgi:hypothetical protein